jgi:hypothetical protein
LCALLAAGEFGLGHPSPCPFFEQAQSSTIFVFARSNHSDEDGNTMPQQLKQEVDSVRSSLCRGGETVQPAVPAKWEQERAALMLLVTQHQKEIQNVMATLSHVTEEFKKDRQAFTGLEGALAGLQKQTKNKRPRTAANIEGAPGCAERTREPLQGADQPRQPPASQNVQVPKLSQQRGGYKNPVAAMALHRQQCLQQQQQLCSILQQQQQLQYQQHFVLWQQQVQCHERQLALMQQQTKH